MAYLVVNHMQTDRHIYTLKKSIHTHMLSKEFKAANKTKERDEITQQMLCLRRRN